MIKILLLCTQKQILQALLLRGILHREDLKRITVFYQLQNVDHIKKLGGIFTNDDCLEMRSQISMIQATLPKRSLQTSKLNLEPGAELCIEQKL